MPKRPNILLIFTDQQRYDTIAALGNQIIRTPTQDSLVREGVAFTSAYTPAPVCVAARCSLILSRWAHQTGCDTNNDMPQDQASLMELLQDAGYETHGTGKMHFMPENRKLWGFESRDFSEECTMQDDFGDFLRANDYGHIVDPQGVRSEYYYVPQPSQLPARLHNTTWVADRSLDFLQQRDQDRPFFMWTSFIKPHPPFENPIPWNRLYKAEQMPLPHLPEGYQDLITFWNHAQNRSKWRNRGIDLHLLRTMRAAYYSAISFVDYNVSRVISHLRESGELDNTLVIWTSDHGEMLGDYGSYGKRTMLDAAHRIPMLVRYPEAFAAGECCDRVTSLVDIMPTCLELAGLPTPDTAVGESLTDAISRRAGTRSVISQFTNGPKGLYSLIGDEHKYVYSAADQREWLFDRKDSPETTDLSAKLPEVTARMRQELTGRLWADGYDQAVTAEGWKEYPPSVLPDDPDVGLGYQDGADVSDWFPKW
jgi:arylsulfatase A-like enzyme